MKGILLFLIPAAIVALLFAPLVPAVKGMINKTQVKHRLIANVCMFVGVCLVCVFVPANGFITALADGGTTASLLGTSAQGMGFIAAALAVGLGSIGAGIAVAAAAPAAIGAFSEDPKAFGKALIFVALGEGVAIYGLLIAILIMNKL